MALGAILRPLKVQIGLSGSVHEPIGRRGKFGEVFSHAGRAARAIAVPVSQRVAGTFPQRWNYHVWNEGGKLGP